MFNKMLQLVNPAWALTGGEVVQELTSKGYHFDLAQINSILIVVVSLALGIITFLIWNIYSGLGRRLDKLDKRVESFQEEAVMCRESLPLKFADKEHTERNIGRLFERQDRLREALPQTYISRLELIQTVDSVKEQVDIFRKEVEKIEKYMQRLTVSGLGQRNGSV